MKKNKAKLLIVGGHAGTVAIAVLEEIKKRQKDWEIHFVGPKYLFEAGKIPSLEKVYLEKNGVIYHELESGKLIKKISFGFFLSIYKFIIGFVNSFILLVKIKPKVTLSLGGYLGVPVVISSRILGILVVIHEQVAGFGLANRISAFFADKVAVARGESIKHIPGNKGIITGNPVRRAVLDIKPKKSMGKVPVIFIFTGSRGSQTINRVVETILEELLEKYIVIHLTGKPDFAKFQAKKLTLNKKRKKRYELYGFINPEKVAEIYEQSDILICRSGANTVAELMVVKRPAILIPISWSIFDEQRKNARFAETFGVARIIEEKDLTGDKLKKEISFIRNNWTDIVGKIKNKKSPDEDASKKLVEILEKYI